MRNFTIDADATGGNPLLDFAAGTMPGICQRLLQLDSPDRRRCRC
jgi:hypothetical protein